MEKQLICKCGETNQDKFYPYGRNQCIECYRIKAINRRKQYSEKHNNKKVEVGKCNKCERLVTKDNTHHFEWNHINPKEKTNTISKLICSKQYEEEVSKCELLCLFCHADVTKQQLINGMLNTKPRKY